MKHYPSRGGLVIAKASLLWPILSIAMPSFAGAQLPAALVEPTHVKRFPAATGRIRDIRELTDGRVLIADGVERALFVVAADGGSRTQLGRQGDGPGEYRSPARLFPLGRDSTLVHDLQSRRWLLLDGTRFVSLPKPLQEVKIGSGSRIDGVDRRGVVLEVSGIGKTIQGDYRPVDIRRPELHGVIAVVTHHAARPPDTAATIRGNYLGATSRQLIINGESLRYIGLLNPLQSHDQAVLFPDGTLAVAYADNYRVDWRTPDRRWVRGRPLGYRAMPVTSALRRELAEAHLRNDDGSPVLNESDFPPWPRTAPPFIRNALFAGLDGLLYIRRTPTVGEQRAVIDVVDRTGQRIATVRLPPRSRFLGAGTRGLYVAEMTPDGEELLARVQWK